MKILHLANDYSGSEVYKNLVVKLDELDLTQTVYTALRNPQLIGKNRAELKQEESRIIYSNILSKYIDRLFLHKKINKIIHDIEFKIDINNVDFIHAHTWYSDGGVAYKLHRKHNIPYIVTIRNTDLNLFYKYFIHERLFGSNILLNAKKIIFISASYKDRVIQQKSLHSINKKIANKFELIPNGIDDFWIKNSIVQKKFISSPVQVLFVGRFTEDKNVIQLLKAIQELNAKFIPVHLHLIGGGGTAELAVFDIIRKNPEIFFYHGNNLDKLLLKSFFERVHIFAMPSKSETFGLVYVEAMLQGLPILYTFNEGIDGLYSENIGEKVTSSEVEEIKNQLIKLIYNYDSYSIPTNKILNTHNWENIAKIYYSIYKSIL